jgi:hypothetical protein
MSAPATVSDQLDRWLTSDGDKTLGSLVEMFGEKSFALLFVILLAPASLPLPTGGATHVLEIAAMLFAVQLIVGRDEIWVPRRWRKTQLAGEGQRRVVTRLLRVIRWLERFSRPRARFLFEHRLGNIVFGVLVVGFSAAAFFAPPFTGLDTLPALAVVLLSLGVLMEDIVVVVAALVLGLTGVALEFLLGRAAVGAIGDLF